MASLRRSARLSSGSAAVQVTETVTATVAALPARPAPRKRKSTAALKADDADEAPRPSTLPPPPPPPPQQPPAKKRRGRPSNGKAATAASSEPAMAPPATPPRAAAATAKTKPTPATPNTSAKRARHPAVSRLADPNATNAPLLSPETSRVVSALPAEDAVPTPLRLQQKKNKTTMTTTANILEEACAHLCRVDPRMQPLVAAHYCDLFSPASLAERVDPFESLASGIISQQVSGAAARAIKGRFIDLFVAANSEQPKKSDSPVSLSKKDPRFPHPSQVAAASIERLRTAGLSQRKAEYLKGLAEKFVSGELSAQLLAEAPYETLVERLVAVRGLGLWSVEMFAMFGLKRMDVFSTGDLGVQRGMAAFAGRDVAKLKRAGSSGLSSAKSSKWKYMTGEEMEATAEKFRPYRSVFMWYMWRVEDTDVSSLGG